MLDSFKIRHVIGLLLLTVACGGDSSAPRDELDASVERDGSRDDADDGATDEPGRDGSEARADGGDEQPPDGGPADDGDAGALDGGADGGAVDAGVLTSLRRILVYNRVDVNPDTGQERGHTGSGKDEELLEELGREHGFEVVITDEGADFTADNLATFDVVVFASPHYLGQALTKAQRDALEAFIRQGGGWVGFHYALKVEISWPFLRELAGGVRLGGHVGGEQDSRYTLVDTNHPVTRGLVTRYTARDDYIKIDGTFAPNVTILATASLDAAPFGDDNPSVWVHEIDRGRVFYSMVGHNAPDFTAPFAKPLLWNALRWAAHDD